MTKRQNIKNIKDLESLLKARVYVRAAYSELVDYYDSSFSNNSQHQMSCLTIYYDLDKEIMDLLEADVDLQSLTMRVAKIKLT